MVALSVLGPSQLRTVIPSALKVLWQVDVRSGDFIGKVNAR